MFGTHRKGFDWKEVAEALGMTRAVSRVAFWREIQRSRRNGIATRGSATVVQDESDPHVLKRIRNRSTR
jgi:hypothetical protein